MAVSPIWMPLYVADYLADTRHLSTVEHGAYLLLIMHAWMSNGELPQDEKRLARIAGLSLAEWEEAADEVLQFFYDAGGCWRSERIDKELERAQALIDQRREAGKASAAKRARQRKVNERSTGVATGDERAFNERTNKSQPPPQSQSPSPSEEQTDQINPLPPSAETADVVRVLGILSAGYVIEAENLIDGWIDAGVSKSVLMELAAKSRGKKNPHRYMAALVKPELEAAAKRKAQQAEQQRQAEQGPDWPQVMKSWAMHRRWPYSMPGIGPEPWKPGARVPAALLEQYSEIIEQERASNAWFEPAKDQSIGF